MIVDTSVLSAWAAGNASVEAVLSSAQRLVVPSIVHGEYYFGIRQFCYRDRSADWLARTLPLIEVAAVASSTADFYVAIRQELKNQGVRYRRTTLG